MDPQSDKSPGLHLPQPSADSVFPVSYEATPAPSGAFGPGGGGSPSLQPSAPPTASFPNDQTHIQTSSSQAGDQADDLDKEWIEKAKLIVEHTKNDPYTQSKEISKVKADYLRIRYNKHLKIGQDKTL